MSDRSSAQSREPDGTVPGDEAETVSPAVRRLASALAEALADAERKRPHRRRILTPIALFVIGAVLGLATIFIYPPSPAPLENPGPAQLTITTAATVTRVEYAVTNGDVEVTVHATPPGGPRASALSAVIQIGPGWTDPNQPPLLSVIAEGMIQKVRVVFAPPPVAWETDFVAHADFVDKTPSIGGLAYNGLTASAAIPEVIISAPRANPELDARYAIPSGSSYDWSPGPPQTAAEWTSHLTRADTPGQVMVGTDHGREDSDNFRIFVAGALAALAGAAVLAALQEALSRFAG